MALLLVLGFLAGLLVTGGPAAAQVGTAGTASAIVLGHFPQPPATALHVAVFVLLGGAGQVVLAVAAWPLGRHRPERDALAALYRDLAAVCRRPAGTTVGPPATVSVDTVRLTLYGLGHDHGPAVEAYRVLLDQTERIRREVVALAGLTERLAADRDAIAAGLVRSALAGSGDVLDEVAAALSAARPVDELALVPTRGHFRRAIRRLEEPGPRRGELTRRATAARLRALSGQLRAVVETSSAGTSEGGGAERREVPGGPGLRDPVAVLRANLSLESAALGHAARLALVLAGSDLVVRLVGYERGYWVPLTVLVVLRPDFASTFQRATMRVVGTIIGLLVATELVHWVPGGDWYRIALIALFFFGVRLAGPGNLGLIAVCLSGLVVVLLAINGVAPRETLVTRSVATAVGGGLALAATLLLPVWERGRVPVRLAELLGAYRHYLETMTDPDAVRGDRERARAAARRARTNAQASVDGARAETVLGRRSVELGETVLANSHRVVHALMTIDGIRSALRRAGRLTELDELLGQADEALLACEQALRTGGPLHAVGSLRPQQERLFARLSVEPGRVGGVETAGALADATDRLANAVDTLVGVIRRQGAHPAAAAPVASGS